MRRKDLIINKIKKILQDAFGIEMHGIIPYLSFREIGLDSLLLMQFASNFKSEFGLPVTFTQLSGEYDTPDRVASYIDQQLPREALVAASAPVEKKTNGSPENRIAGMEQLESAPVPQKAKEAALSDLQEDPDPAARSSPPEPFAGDQNDTEFPFTKTQQYFLDQLLHRYHQKTRSSFIQAHPESKEGVADLHAGFGYLDYPLIIQRANRSHLWDLDGNEYIDTGVFSGPAAFPLPCKTHSKFDYLWPGKKVHPARGKLLEAELCQHLATITGFDTVSLYHTTQDARLAAINRCLRTATQSLVVVFSGNSSWWHAAFNTLPGRNDFPQKMAGQQFSWLLLEPGRTSSLQILKQRSGEIACVMTDPLECLGLGEDAAEFLKTLHKTARALELPLLFDESSASLKMTAGGIRNLVGFNPDVSILGNLFGGPGALTALAGNREWVVSSETSVLSTHPGTVFSQAKNIDQNTYVIKDFQWMAKALGWLRKIEDSGSEIYERLYIETSLLAKQLNQAFDRLQVPFTVVTLGCYWAIQCQGQQHIKLLLLALLREKGLFINGETPGFITASHSRKDIQHIVKAIVAAANEMVQAGFFDAGSWHSNMDPYSGSFAGSVPIVTGAKLGMDSEGNPGWFISDPLRTGFYCKVIAD